MIAMINRGSAGIPQTLVGFSQGISQRREVYGVSEADAAEAARLVMG
jgi:hypothetical protein